MTASLSLPIVSLTVQTALADQRDFTLHNESSVDIQEVYVSDSGDSNWGPDILGQDVLLQGEPTDVVFEEDDSQDCLYDLKAVGAGGEELDACQVNLCEVADYTITD